MAGSAGQNSAENGNGGRFACCAVSEPAGRRCETYKFCSFLLTLGIRRFIPAYVRRKSARMEE
jgi:hypothetical protein